MNIHLSSLVYTLISSNHQTSIAQLLSINLNSGVQKVIKALSLTTLHDETLLNEKQIASSLNGTTASQLSNLNWVKAVLLVELDAEQARSNCSTTLFQLCFPACGQGCCHLRERREPKLLGKRMLCKMRGRKCGEEPRSV